MELENNKTKSWFDTLSEIIKDQFIGLNLTKEIGEQLIKENIDLHNEVNSLMEIVQEIRDEKNLKIQNFHELDYHSVINCKNINDFFQINRSFILNANLLLEKLSGVLKKTIAGDSLTPEEKNFLLREETHCISPNITKQQELIKSVNEKNEEIKKLHKLLEEKENAIKNLKEDLSAYKIKFENMRLNFSFDSIENINRNIHFFDEKLFRQKTEKHKNQQMSLLNAFQQNLNSQGLGQKIDIGGLFGNTSHSKKPENKSLNEPEDPYFIKAWDLLLQRFDEEYNKLCSEEDVN